MTLCQGAPPALGSRVHLSPFRQILTGTTACRNIAYMNLDGVIERGRARRELRGDPGLGKVLRLRSGLTQAEVAAALGVDRSAVSRWEAGARIPRGRALDRYKQLLDRLTREAS